MIISTGAPILSDIGSAEHLCAYGMPVQADLPGVGRRLYDQPNMPLEFDHCE